MRIDVTRERDPDGDRGGNGLCRCDGLVMSIRNAPHNKGSKGCKHYEAVVIARSLLPRSKHSPITPDEECPF